MEQTPPPEVLGSPSGSPSLTPETDSIFKRIVNAFAAWSQGKIYTSDVQGWMVLTKDDAEKIERDRDMLKAAGYVLKEAVEKLLDSDEDLKNTSDEELEEAMENGYATEIRTQAETILLARKALGMTSYLFPENAQDQTREPKTKI
jgi:hypothetical protein